MQQQNSDISSSNERVRAVVQAAVRFHDDSSWIAWAKDWLSGKKVSDKRTAKAAAKAVVFWRYFRERQPRPKLASEFLNHPLKLDAFKRMMTRLRAVAAVSLAALNPEAADLELAETYVAQVEQTLR